MKTKSNTKNMRVFLIVLLMGFWVLMIRLISRGNTFDIGFLGFLVWIAFLIFSMKWTIGQLMQSTSTQNTNNRI